MPTKKVTLQTVLDVVDGASAWVLLNANAYELVHDLRRRFVDGRINRLFDHTLTDPGYDSRTHAGARGSRGRSLGINFSPTDPRSYLADVLTLTRRWSLVFCSLEMLAQFQMFGGSAYRKGGVWVKPDSAPQFNGKGPAQGVEGLAIMHYFKNDRGGQDSVRWNAGGRRAVWTHGVERIDRFVPTQKPVRLLVELIEEFTDPGDVIFDMFAGAASVGVAALLTGRRYVGVELSRDVYVGAVLRLNAYSYAADDPRHGEAREKFDKWREKHVSKTRSKKVR